MEVRIIRPPASEEELYLNQKLRQLRESYEEEAKPYIDRLVHIRSMEIPRYEVFLQPHEHADMARFAVTLPGADTKSGAL